jgi:hypothetical protein
MNTEELKMILDAMTSLGANGKEAFIWWLALKYGTALLTSGMILTAVLGVPYLILRTVRQASARNAALKEIANAVGVDFWDWSDGDPHEHGVTAVIEAFRASRSK